MKKRLFSRFVLWGYWLACHTEPGSFKERCARTDRLHYQVPGPDTHIAEVELQCQLGSKRRLI
jgi:hypothetical protein